MAWLFKGVATVDAHVGGALTLVVPPGTKDGDLMVARVNHDSGSAIPNPVGWTLIAGVAQSTFWQGVWYRIASREPGSYVWAVNAADPDCTGDIMVFSGNMTAPLHASSQVIGDGTSFTNPPIGNMPARTLAIYAGGVNEIGTWTPPIGMTERADHASGGTSGVLATQEYPDGGSTEAKAGITAITDHFIGHLVTFLGAPETRLAGVDGVVSATLFPDDKLRSAA